MKLTRLGTRRVARWVRGLFVAALIRGILKTPRCTRNSRKEIGEKRTGNNNDEDGEEELNYRAGHQGLQTFKGAPKGCSPLQLQVYFFFLAFGTDTLVCTFSPMAVSMAVASCA